MQTIKISNGDTLQFPDEMPDDQIHAAIQKEYGNPGGNKSPESKSLMSDGKRSRFRDAIANTPVDRFRDAAAQSLGNAVIGAADLLPGVHIAPINDWSSGDGIAEKAGGFTGGMASFGMGGRLLKGASSLPSAESAITKGINYIKNSPYGKKVLEKLSNPFAKSVAGNALFGAVENPDHQFKGAAEGGLFGASGHGLGKLLGTSNPIIKAIGGGLLGTAVGYAAGGKTGAELGGVAGAGASLYPGAGSRAIKNILGPLDRGAIESTLKNSRDLGIDIKPTEVTGSPERASLQGKLSATEEGAPILHESGQARLAQEQASIDQLLRDIIPSKKNVSEATRDTARSVIDKLKKTRAEAASPLYEQSRGDVISTTDFKDILKDPYLNQIFHEVHGNNLKADKIKEHPINSVNMLDLMKKNIDLKIKAAQRGHLTEDVSDLKAKKDKLLNITDQVSETYKKARETYAAGSEPVTATQESPIGKIANMKDSQLKNVSKTIFDPTQTDQKVFTQLRDAIHKENPEVWRHLVRNEIERSISDGSVKGVGTNFYKKILKDENTYQQFKLATANMPDVQKKLVKMRDVFGKLINPVSPEYASKEARANEIKKTGFGPYKKTMEFVDKFLSGKYNKEAAKLLTDPQWDKRFDEISKIKNKEKFAQKMGDLLGTIGNVELNK